MRRFLLALILVGQGAGIGAQAISGLIARDGRELASLRDVLGSDAAGPLLAELSRGSFAWTIATRPGEEGSDCTYEHGFQFLTQYTEVGGPVIARAYEVVLCSAEVAGGGFAVEARPGRFTEPAGQSPLYGEGPFFQGSEALGVLTRTLEAPGAFEALLAELELQTFARVQVRRIYGKEPSEPLRYEVLFSGPSRDLTEPNILEYRIGVSWDRESGQVLELVILDGPSERPFPRDPGGGEAPPGGSGSEGGKGAGS